MTWITEMQEVAREYLQVCDNYNSTSTYEAVHENDLDEMVASLVTQTLQKIEDAECLEEYETDYREGDIIFVKHRSHNMAVRAFKQFIQTLKQQEHDT